MRASRANRRLRWLAVALAFAITPVIGVRMVSAQSDDTAVNTRQVITSQLDAQGDVTGVKMDNWTRAEGSGQVDIKVPAILSDIEGDPRPDVDGTNVIYSTDVAGANPTDLYFSGNAKIVDGNRGVVQTPSGPETLPLRVRTTYSFNGAEVDDLDTIAGLAGEFEMNVSMTNTTGVPQEITYTDSTSGKEVTEVGFVFTPLTVKAGPWFFEDEFFKDIEVEGALLGRNGKGTEVSTSAVLFPPTTPAEASFKVTAQTKNFRLNSGRITAAPGIGTTQSKLVSDAQELGGGRTKLLYDALLQFLDGFEKLTSPTEGLPFAADGIDRIIQEGLFLLRDTLFDAGVAIRDTALPQYKKLFDGLVTLRDQVRDDLAPATAQLRDVLGGSNYFNPMCRDLPVNRAGACTFDQGQLPEVPPMPALRDSYVLAGNADTRGLDPNSDTFKKDSRYSYERIQRTKAGEIGGDLRSTLQSDDGGYFGSLYNWAAFIKFSMQSAVDADKDGVPEFDPFVYPNPDQFPQYYTSSALDFVALKKGEYFPGFTATGGVSENPFAADLCDTIAGLNNETALETCGNVPASDVTLRDLLTDRAQERLNDIPIKIDLGGLLGGLGLGDTATALGVPSAGARAAAGDVAGQLDQVRKDYESSPLWVMLPQSEKQRVAKQLDEASKNLEAVSVGAPASLAAFALDRTPPSGYSSAPAVCQGITLGVCIPLPTGLALTGGSNKGVNNLLGNPDQLTLQGFAFDQNNPGGYEALRIPFQRSTCVTSGTSAGTDPLSFNLGEALGLNCNLALAGALGTVEASTTVIQKLLYSEGWNFDNWLRGDPGYQVEDLGVTGTGPKLNQALNIIAYSVDRKDAMCPSSLVTDATGGGTPRIIPPKLDTPCDQVLPDNSTDDPKTLVGALSNAIIPGVGDPTAGQKLDENGDPANFATVFLQLVEGLTVDVPEAIGTDDPADVGVTLAGSLAAVRDGLADAATQLAPAVTGTPLLAGAVAGAQISGDLATALSKAGVAQAEKMQSFMGAATASGDTEVTSNVVFVFETVGVKW